MKKPPLGAAFRCAAANGLQPVLRLELTAAAMLDLDWAPGKPVALSVEAAEALGVGEGASVRLVAV